MARREISRNVGIWSRICNNKNSRKGALSYSSRGGEKRDLAKRWNLKWNLQQWKFEKRCTLVFISWKMPRGEILQNAGIWNTISIWCNLKWNLQWWGKRKCFGRVLEHIRIWPWRKSWKSWKFIRKQENYEIMKTHEKCSKIPVFLFEQGTTCDQNFIVKEAWPIFGRNCGMAENCRMEYA